MIDLLTEYGFTFAEMCSICKNRYKVFKNAAKPHVEIKVHVSGNYFKMFSPDGKGRIRQTAFGSVNRLKEIIGTI